MANKKKKPDGFINPRQRFDNLKYFAPVDLIPTHNNPRDHSESHAALLESIKQYGWTVPIILHRPKRNKDGSVHKKSPLKIIAGHNRHQVALGLYEDELLDEVPCVFIDDLSEAQAKAYLLDDNRVSDLSDWVPLELHAFMKNFDGLDVQPIGWSPDELEDLKREYTPAPVEPPDEFPTVGLHMSIDHKCPKCGYEWSGDGQKKSA